MGVLSACLPTLGPILEVFMHNSFYIKLQGFSTRLLSNSKGRFSKISPDSLEDGSNYDSNEEPA